MTASAWVALVGNRALNPPGGVNAIHLFIKRQLVIRLLVTFHDKPANPLICAMLCLSVTTHIYILLCCYVLELLLQKVKLNNMLTEIR